MAKNTENKINNTGIVDNVFVQWYHLSPLPQARREDVNLLGGAGLFEQAPAVKVKHRITCCKQDGQKEQVLVDG